MSVVYPEVSDVEEFSPTYCCHNRFFFDNVFEEISEPGEYYINVSSQMIYAIPPTNLTGSAESPVVASLQVAPLFSFADGSSNITVANISLSSTRGTAIDAQKATGVQLKNLEISNIGLVGVELGPGSSLKSSHLHGIGASGVVVVAGTTTTLMHGDSTVSNCHIHHFAVWNKVYQPAVSVNGVGNTGAFAVLDCILSAMPLAVAYWK